MADLLKNYKTQILALNEVIKGLVVSRDEIRNSVVEKIVYFILKEKQINGFSCN